MSQGDLLLPASESVARQSLPASLHEVKAGSSGPLAGYSHHLVRQVDEPDAGLSELDRSSSPLHTFSSSPSIDLTMARHRIAHSPGEQDDLTISGATTVVSEDEGEKQHEGSGQVEKTGAYKHRRVVFSEDEDESSNASEKEEDGVDGLAFLSRFRARHHAEETGSTDTAQLSRSSLFSGTLSEPPSSLHQSTGVAANSISHSSLSSGSETGAYITEAQKQREKDRQRASREEKVKGLAARASHQRVAGVHETSSPQVEDEISSSSEIEVDQSDRHSLLANDWDLTDSSRAAAAEPLRNKDGQKNRRRGLVLSNDHESGNDDNHSSLSDAEVQAPPTAEANALKPLSKKELAEMDRVQARIDREKRVSLAKTAREPHERKRFGLQDLIANIRTSEMAKRELALSRMGAPDPSMRVSPSSDPIETSSGSEDEQRDRTSTPVPFRENDRRGNRPLHVRIKEKFPAGMMQAHMLDDEVACTDALPSWVRNEEDRGKWRRLQGLKAAALLDTSTSTTPAPGASRSQVEDDDLELYDAKNQDSVEPRSIAKPYVKPSRVEEMARNLHLPKTPVKMRKPRQSAHSASPSRAHRQHDSSDSDDAEVTASQLQRAGRAFGQAVGLSDGGSGRIELKKDGTPKARRTSRIAESRLTRKDLDSFMRKQIEIQNIKLRNKRGRGGSGDSDMRMKQDDKSGFLELLDKLQQKTKPDALSGTPVQENIDDEDDSDFIPDDEAQQSDVDYGSGNESSAETEPSEGSPSADSETPLHHKQDLPSIDNTLSPHDSPDILKARGPRRVRKVIDDDEDGGETHREVVRGYSSDRRTMPASRQGNVLDSVDEDNGALNVLLEPDAPGDLAEFFLATPEPDVASAGGSGSNNSSTLGAFFQDTQTDAPLRGESFPVLSGTGSAGFTQLFEQGSPVPFNDRALMPPPETSAKGLSLFHGSESDGFAALRRAQASAAMVMDDEPADLPVLEDLLGPQQEEEIMALELEAIRAEEEERVARLANRRAENDITYINKEGFFTQTRPESYSFKLSQSQSQPQEDQHPPSNHIFEGHGPPFELSEHPESAAEPIEEADGARRRRFRRAAVPSNESILGGRDASTGQGMGEGLRHDKVAGESPSSSAHAAAPRSAFDLIREGAAQARTNAVGPKPDSDPRAARRFVEGEAEESDGDSDEGEWPSMRKRDRGGLNGVFSDEENGAAEEEEDDDGDDRDLEGLIDEQRDEEEAEKDVLARQRYFQDREEDEKAALALHERATRGAFRNKRRSRNQDGTLEGFLEEDYEDDWLEKVARNPYGNIAKKRRLQGKDAMDLLAEKEECQAFVREYRQSHRDDHDLDAYAFLRPPKEDDGEDTLNFLPGRQTTLEDVASDEDRHGSDESPPPRRISRKELQETVAARRRTRRERAMLHLSDEEADEDGERERIEEERRRERELQRNLDRVLFNLSDDEENGGALHGASRSNGSNGKTSKSKVVEQAAASAEEQDEEENSLPVAMPGLVPSRTVSERERARWARLAKEYENEPDWRSAKAAIPRGRRAPQRPSAHALRADNIASTSDGQAQQPKSSRIDSQLLAMLSRADRFSESI